MVEDHPSKLEQALQSKWYRPAYGALLVVLGLASQQLVIRLLPHTLFPDPWGAMLQILVRLLVFAVIASRLAFALAWVFDRYEGVLR